MPILVYDEGKDAYYERTNNEAKNYVKPSERQWFKKLVWESLSEGEIEKIDPQFNRIKRIEGYFITSYHYDIEHSDRINACNRCGTSKHMFLQNQPTSVMVCCFSCGITRALHPYKYIPTDPFAKEPENYIVKIERREVSRKEAIQFLVSVKRNSIPPPAKLRKALGWSV